MKKILYLSYDGLTDPLGQSQVLPYLLGLAAKGYCIHILSAEKKNIYGERKEMIQELIHSQGLGRIHWHPIFYTKKPPVLSTLYDLMQIRRGAVRLHKIEKFEIVHCRSYISALNGLYLKRRFGLSFLFDMRGFWADERVEGNIWNLKNPLFRMVYQYFKGREKVFLKEADAIVSLTENAKTEIVSWKISNAPISVIPCCVDTALFDYHSYPLPQKDKLRLVYLGSLGTWYMLDEMLLFFQALLKQKPDAEWLIITKDDPEMVYQKAKPLSIPLGQIVIRPAERKEVPLLLADSDLAVFFIKPSFSKKASSATKMAEILGMGIPILSNKGVGDHEFLHEQYHWGTLVSLDPKEADYFENKISEAIQSLEIPKEKLREIALDYFSLQKGVEMYASIYESL